MISLNRLHDKATITTGEAITTAELIVQQYSAVLANVLRIKKEVPTEGETSFRRSSSQASPSNTALLEALTVILQDFSQEVALIKQNLLNQHESKR